MVEPYRATGTGPKVLIIDADAPFASALRHALALLGCAVVVVRDGEDGLARAASDRPQLIVLSLELPGTNGFGVCNRLKKEPTLRSIPLVAVSSETPDETVEQHGKLRTRADLYVRKPIAVDELLRRVAPWLQTSGERAT